MKNKTLVLFILTFFISITFAADLDKILEKGFIEFAVYDNFPPYSYKDKAGKVKGVDVDLGRAIAEELGVQSGFRLFLADESVDDDLRNMVWKGHYLAGDPADVMLHAPYDVNFARSNDKVIFTQPYFREVVAFAVNTSRIRSARDLHVFVSEPIGVETATLADAYLLGAYDGRLRENVKHYKNVANAVAAMVNGEVSAVMANRGELEHSLLQHQHDFVITKLPTPGLSVEGWEVGFAVSAEDENLAERIHDILSKFKKNGRIQDIYKANGLSYHPAKSSDLLEFTDTGN